MDLTADWLILGLRSSDIAFRRMHVEDYPLQASVSWEMDDSPQLLLPDGPVRVADLASVWMRKPWPTSPGRELPDWSARETYTVLDSIWRAFPDRCINLPDHMVAASSRCEQLLRARRHGFQTPATFLTCELDDLRSFVSACGGQVLWKALRNEVIDTPAGRARFHAAVLDADQLSELALGPEPGFFQAYVDKAFDIRVTVIGSKVFPVRISGDAHPRRIGWSETNISDLQHEPEDLPGTLSERCAALVRSYDLSYAAIDLVQSNEGEMFFLELNPCPQWAWLDLVTDLDLRTHLIELLLAPGPGTPASSVDCDQH